MIIFKKENSLNEKIAEVNSPPKSPKTNGLEKQDDDTKLAETMTQTTNQRLATLFSRSDSPSSSSSHTSYQDLPSCLHESFNECRTRLTSRLTESFEQRSQRLLQDETAQTISFARNVSQNVGNHENTSFYATPLSPIQPTGANPLNLSKEEELTPFRRNINSPNPTSPINGDYKSSFREDSKFSSKPEYFYTSSSLLKDNFIKPPPTSVLLTSSPVYHSYPTKSAFESDPEVIMMRHRLANRMTSRQQQLSSHLDPTYFEPNYATPSSRRINQEPSSRFDNDYMNIITCRVRKEGLGAKDFVKNGQESEADEDTIESTHLDSDYAKSPIFPSDVYGSRPSVTNNQPTGIYSNKVNINLFFTQLSH